MRALALLGLLATAACGLDKVGLGADVSDANSTFLPGAGDGDTDATDGARPVDASTTDDRSETGSTPSADGGSDADAGSPALDAGDAGDARNAGDSAQDASDASTAADASADVVDEADVVEEEAAVLSSEGGADAPSDATSAPDAPPSCVDSIPAGWRIAVYDLGPDLCPASFTEHDVLGAPTVGDGACACACTVTEDGSCTQGTLSTSGDTLNANACGNAWFTVPITADSVCTTIPVVAPPTRPVPLSFQAAPLPGVGGTCTTTLLTDPTQVSAPPARYCDVPAARAEAVCGGVVPSGFAACIATAGATSCPPGSAFAHPFVVEDAAALECSDCGACSVSTTCADAVLTVHSGARCMDTGVDLVVDGTCNPTGFAGVKAATAVEYTATESSTCDPGSSTASAQLTNVVTLCCL